MLLFFGSILLTFAVLEYFLFPKLLTHLPLKLHFAVRPELRLLTQVSKDSVIPESYIAIFGDSYAQGYGDWLLNADVNTNPPFHSANVLHDLLGEDIISFGNSGSSNMQGLIGNPVSWLNYINTSRFKKLGLPKEIIFYFYEGNDLNDNLLDLKLRYMDRNFDPARVYEEKYFRNFLEKEVIRHNGKDNTSWFNEFYLVDFISKILEGPEETVHDDVVPFKEGTVNRAIVGGKEINMPDGLHSPSLELSSNEIHLGIYILKQSLSYMLQHFTGIKVSMVYLPSVMTCYEMSSTYISFQPYDKGRETLAKASQISLKSDQIYSLVLAVTQELGVPLFDTRPILREAGSRKIIHGPMDWKHLNKEGYHILANAIVKMRERTAKTHS